MELLVPAGFFNARYGRFLICLLLCGLAALLFVVVAIVTAVNTSTFL